MKAGDEISSRPRVAIASVTQAMFKPRQKPQDRRVASRGASSSSGKLSSDTWIRSTRTPCSSAVPQRPVAATRSDCHTISRAREIDSSGIASRYNIAAPA
jgi:hypothetical protein